VVDLLWLGVYSFVPPLSLLCCSSLCGKLSSAGVGAAHTAGRDCAYGKNSRYAYCVGTFYNIHIDHQRLATNHAKALCCISQHVHHL
jgi:hypothetical protein